MLVITKQSKFDKVDSELFQVVTVSREITSTKGVDAVNLGGLYPPAELAIKADNMGKKKFAKKYKEFLKSEAAQVEIFNLVLAIKSAKKGFLFVCSDDEWDLGYLQCMAEYMMKTFGYTFIGIKDAAKEIKKALSSLSKKEKKNEKKYNKFVKEMQKGFRSEYMKTNGSGDEVISELRKKFAVDYVVFSAIQSGFAIMDGNDIKVADDKHLRDMKTSSFVSAIEASSESCKKYKKIIREVLKSHDLKLNKKSLKKQGKAEMLYLTVEILAEIQKARFDSEDK